MPTYQAPLRDIRFVLHEMLGVEKIAELPGYEDATTDIVDAVLEEGAKLCENELQPLNYSGDQEGCTYENGVVRTPEGLQGSLRRPSSNRGWCRHRVRSEIRRPGPAQGTSTSSSRR